MRDRCFSSVALKGFLEWSWYLSGRINVSHCVSSLWPGFNSRPRRSTSRDFSLADHTRCFVHSSGCTKERSGAPLEKSSWRSRDAYGSAWTSSGRHWSTAKRDKKKGSRGLCERRWVTVKVWKLCELTHSHSETARLPRMPRMLWDYLWHWMGCSLSLALNGGLLYFKVLPGRKCIFCITLLSCAGHLRVENFSTCVFNLMRVRGQRNTSLWGELWDTLVGRALWDSSVDRALWGSSVGRPLWDSAVFRVLWNGGIDQWV